MKSARAGGASGRPDVSQQPGAAPAGESPGGRPSPSRRRLLTGAGLAGAGLVAGGVGGYFAHQPGTAPARTAAGADSTVTVPFYGAHQAGIATPAQDRLAFGSLNVMDGVSRSDLRDLLVEWTQAAARMTTGQLVGEVSEPVAPPLPNENLDPSSSGGDLCVQACSDDPLVAFHAVRNLARIGMGVVEHNWLELGFGRTSTTSTAQQTPRNLLGFKDGTRNIKAEQASLMSDYVWVGRESDQAWLRGGSYLVARKIRMHIENWDRDYLRDQENVIGQSKVNGAPLSGGSEFSEPDFTMSGADGQPAIPVDAHVRLASHEHNGGTRILRRGYSFTDGIDPQTGTLLGGLFFIAFMRHPGQFVKLQTALATDALNEYVHHVGSAVFACPPGLSSGQHWGDTLFA